jgi:solute:Na+ symporter, SSS family
MSNLDWIVLVSSLLFIVLYGVWKGRGQQNIDSYLLADKQLPWYYVGLSVMATQASAITFLSTPGLAYNKGMGFVQFYFGLPFAMIVLCVTFIPIFQRLNVYTAYEFLEKRFDVKTRTLTALLFLIQRGLSTGISIYAPAIILSTIFNINISLTCGLIGGLVIIYTVYGGTKAVAYTQVLQMVVMFSGMFVAGVLVIKLLPADVGFTQAMNLADILGKTQAIDTHFDPSSQYNVWSGLIGGFFLQLSYFGTDQSQVGRYLTGKNIKESQQGLILNGIVKIPMQYLILLLGVLVFVFYQYNQPPIYFNEYEVEQIKQSPYKSDFERIETQYQTIFQTKNKVIQATPSNSKTIVAYQNQLDSLRREASQLISKYNPKATDKDYIFLYFILHNLPKGMIGLLIAIITLASMGALAAGLNSLGSATVIDFYKRLWHTEDTPEHYLTASRWFTIGWGIFCILIALFASDVGNLIEAVNVLGSWFYGTILGVFIAAFYVKQITAKAVFWAAILSEIGLIAIDYYTDIAYLWFNPIGCVLVVGFGLVLSELFDKSRATG